MLRNHGEFYPLASAIDSSGKIAQMGAYDGNEHPKSVDVINNLKKSLKQGAQKGEYSAITIFYDSRVVNPHTNIKTDAIAVFAETKVDTTAYMFYYPYTISLDKQVNLSKSFGSKIQKEIFSN